MHEIRSLFLTTAGRCGTLLAAPEVATSWDEPSALEHFSVSGLAGHLVRATGSVEAYLDRDEPAGDPIAAAAYYAAAVGETDLLSELHVAVRARGEEEARDGHAALVARHEAIVARLTTRLEEEPAGRRLRVFKDMVLTLDDYLVTRIVEQLVHLDDLAVSVGVATPDLPADAMEVALGALLDVARHRHGDLAVLRAFSRRERDEVAALRVF